MEEQDKLRTESSDDGKHQHRRRSPWLNQPHYDHDRFSNFMFGARQGGQENMERHNVPDNNQHNQKQNQTYIDYEQLMVSIDSLVESTRNLKPLFQRFFPFIEKFWKRK